MATAITLIVNGTAAAGAAER